MPQELTIGRHEFDSMLLTVLRDALVGILADPNFSASPMDLARFIVGFIDECRAEPPVEFAIDLANMQTKGNA